MENNDCESVSEAKGQTMKKKVNVLEAMAKYNLKKQQERELGMKAPLKLKPSPPSSPQDSTKKKYFRPKREYIETEKRQYQPKKEYIQTERRETDVGISQYVCKGPGFSAILKQRYSDFQVHEIDMDGNIIHLTNQTIVKYVDTTQTEVVVERDILTEDQWKSIEEMVKTGNPKSVEIDVTEISKEKRQSIHKTLRMMYEDENITSNSNPVDGKTILKVFKMEGRLEKRRNEQRRFGSLYTQFVLYKENLSTMEAVNTIARILKMKSGCFMTAGTKDKRAITSQLVTVRNTDPVKILNSVRNNNKIAVGNFSFTKEPLQLGNLKGNRFIIALRNVIGNEGQILENLKSLQEIGFINYYGAQRFGTRQVPTHHIGKQLILGEWQRAIDLILEPPELDGKFQREYDLTLARIEYKSSKDANKAFLKIKRSSQTIEAQLLFNLKKCGKDLVGALDTIPRNMRLTYIHAYQSFHWNTVVSKRLSKFGPVPIVGDLVFASGSDGSEVGAEFESMAEESSVVEPENDQSSDKEADGEKSNPKAQRNQRKVMFIDENNIKDYTINEVILPLPGFDITYPANEVAGWYTELLQADGLTEMDFKQRTKTYNLGGAYRLVMSKPSDVKWKFVRYDDPTLSLIPSDWNRLEKTEPPPAAVKDGVYLGMVLEFNLPASSYATMALREIIKMDMSAEFQTSLNDAGGTKHQAPPDATSTETAANQPEVKRIKLEPDTDMKHAPPAAAVGTIESSDDPLTKKIKQEKVTSHENI